MYLQLYVVRNYNFKTISDEEMEPNFLRMKVLTISVANKLCEERLDLSVKAYKLAIKLTDLFRRLFNQFGPQHQRRWAENKECWLLQKQNVFLSSLLTPCFFRGRKHALTPRGLWCFPTLL